MVWVDVIAHLGARMMGLQSGQSLDEVRITGGCGMPLGAKHQEVGRVIGPDQPQLGGEPLGIHEQRHHAGRLAVRARLEPHGKNAERAFLVETERTRHLEGRHRRGGSLESRLLQSGLAFTPCVEPGRVLCIGNPGLLPPIQPVDGYQAVVGHRPDHRAQAGIPDLRALRPLHQPPRKPQPLPDPVELGLHDPRHLFDLIQPIGRELLEQGLSVATDLPHREPEHQGQHDSEERGCAQHPARHQSR
jgi:hypothetical protein